MTVLESVKQYGTAAYSYIKDNLGVIGAGVGGAALGAAVGYAAGTKSTVSKKRKSTKSKARRSKSNYRKKRRSNSFRRGRKGRYTPHTAGKRRDSSHRRIRQTKNGQPYIILASGKARFIKKSSARSSRKKNGGRY